MAKQRAMMIGLDGADPLVVKKLMDEGRLPNFKKFLEQGVAHQSLGMLGVNPTVTPPNWASIATGNWLRTHGVTDFYTHTLGNPLNLYQMNWDARLIQSELIWEAFERGGKKAVCLNYCGAWPPRVEGTQNIFIDGTGATPFLRDFVDFQKVAVFSPDEEKLRYFPHYVDPSNVGDCIVYSDQIDAMREEQEKFESEQDGYTNEPLYVFLATELKTQQKHLDEDEFLDTVRMPFVEALKMVMAGDIKDAKTVYAILRYALQNKIGF